jgi:DNA-binding NarL/FixJ family response regulator
VIISIVDKISNDGRRAKTRAKATPAPPKRGITPVKRVRIVVVDDHKFMREVISAMLGRQAERYDVVGEGVDAAGAVQQCEKLQPDLLLLDINLPDRSGVEVVPDIKRVSPQTRILLCTAYVSDERIIDALRSGAHGFVEKTNSWNDFADAVDRVSRGEHYFAVRSSDLVSPSRAMAGDSGLLKTPLSQREKEVLTLIAQGKTSKEAATLMGISVATVDTHRTNLMSKLQIHNVAGLVVYAFRAGLIR